MSQNLSPQYNARPVHKLYQIPTLEKVVTMRHSYEDKKKAIKMSKSSWDRLDIIWHYSSSTHANGSKEVKQKKKKIIWLLEYDAVCIWQLVRVFEVPLAVVYTWAVGSWSDLIMDSHTRGFTAQTLLFYCIYVCEFTQIYFNIASTVNVEKTPKFLFLTYW